MIIETLKTSIELLYINDFQLLENKVHEQAVAHRIAHYLEIELEQFLRKNNLSVDCEYNKSLRRSKVFCGRCENCKKECFRDILLLWAEDPSFRKCRPDIILHERLTDNNVVAIEIKKISRSLRTKDTDSARIRMFTCSKGSFKYQDGFTIIYDKKRTVICHYKEGYKVYLYTYNHLSKEWIIAKVESNKDTKLINKLQFD